MGRRPKKQWTVLMPKNYYSKHWIKGKQNSQNKHKNIKTVYLNLKMKKQKKSWELVKTCKPRWIVS